MTWMTAPIETPLEEQMLNQRERMAIRARNELDRQVDIMRCMYAKYGLKRKTLPELARAALSMKTVPPFTEADWNKRNVWWV